MGGRAIMDALKALALDADPAQCALVIRQFTKFAEAPVSVNLDLALFDKWYKMLQQKHRQLPRKNRKTDGEICEYLNILFFAQPTWRDLYEIRISSGGISGNLTQTLLVVRNMLEKRDIYAQIDAEQHGTHSAFAAFAAENSAKIAANPDGPSGGATKSNPIESNNIKRGFGILLAAGDTAAAFSVAAQAGFSRATADPKKATASITDATEYTQLPRDASGAITKFVPGARKCHCGGEHLYRDCPQNDMWKQKANGKWEWIGGGGWVNGKPPAGFNRKKAGKSATTHSAKVADINEESELAEQLSELRGSAPGS